MDDQDNQNNPVSVMDEYQMKVLVKRFFAHKALGTRQTQLLRNLATRAYLIGYEQAQQDLRKQNENQSQ